MGVEVLVASQVVRLRSPTDLNAIDKHPASEFDALAVDNKRSIRLAAKNKFIHLFANKIQNHQNHQNQSMYGVGLGRDWVDTG
ncbi:predicted protein [Sclerotinia sclerotiorum 1980 UF-70]|uniref:Uncharacterized protein n=1 Tax=Sclerotinia sclerotiorum (strain ATCC 18683 / 1980 / Ss-1) TaxID=665079 RepID=A7ETK9_SCLS1|nr:predicted protein [Sclerotinia sclerotiorum 1980 UF-70]EDN92801.1 predicted protein [Sclerotinia sclerotiorum 1980 UF-70]